MPVWAVLGVRAVFAWRVHDVLRHLFRFRRVHRTLQGVAEQVLFDRCRVAVVVLLSTIN